METVWFQEEYSKVILIAIFVYLFVVKAREPDGVHDCKLPTD